MEKSRRKRIINRKAGSHDLFYATTASALTKLDMELTHISGRTLLAIRVGAACYLGSERFLHSDVGSTGNTGAAQCMNIL